MRHKKFKSCIKGSSYVYSLSCIFCVAVMFAGTVSLNATTVMHMPMDFMLAHSSMVIVGTVSEKIHVTGEDETLPSTVYTLCNLEQVVGDVDRSCIEIVTPGGLEEDGSYITATGMPELFVDKRYLLFLTEDNEYISPFTGWWQGVYRVEGPSNSILSLSGNPVLGFTMDGFVKTDRNRRVLSTDSGGINVVMDREVLSMSLAEAINYSISKEEFLSYVYFAANSRLLAGGEIPKGLPNNWHCNTRRNIETETSIENNRTENIPQYISNKEDIGE